MNNKFTILLITYPDGQDVNYSIIRDKMNDNNVIKGLEDRNMLVQLKKGVKFLVELIEKNGDVIESHDEINDKFFEHVFEVMDQMPIGSTEKERHNRSDDIAQTVDVSTNIPSDESDQEMANAVHKIKRKLGDQERDDHLIGDIYQEVGFSSPADKEYTEEDYLRMKRKYLELKEKITKQK